MIILGIDPGIGRMGYAIVKHSGSQNILAECGCITTPAKTDESARLLEIKKDLDQLMKKWKPEVMCIESLFFKNNAKTAMSVGQARGSGSGHGSGTRPEDNRNDAARGEDVDYRLRQGGKITSAEDAADAVQDQENTQA
jgi:hypothetical protein